MKYLFYLLIFLSTFSVEVFGQINKELEFKNTLEQVVKHISNKDSIALSSYIDKNTGIYIIWQSEIYPFYEHEKQLSFAKMSNFVNRNNYWNNITLTPLKYSTLPKFELLDNKDNYIGKWSQFGSFVDTTSTSHLLSETAKTIIEHDLLTPNKHPELSATNATQTIKNMEKLELLSRRIVIVNEENKDLILYLSYLNKKWYLTMIDVASTGAL